MPAVRDRYEVLIQGGPQALHQGRQWIGEIPIFAALEAVPGHDDMTAESRLLAIESGDCAALRRGEQLRQDRPTLCIEIGGDGRPIDRLRTVAHFARLHRRAHATASRLISFFLRLTPQR